MVFKSIIGAACACLLIAISINSAHALTYTITDLGTLGRAYSSGTGINDSGMVSGFSFYPDSAFIYDGNEMRDIGTPGSVSRSNDINNNGWVTGFNAGHAFIYDGNTMQDIGTLGGAGSGGFGINDNGWVTGNSSTTILPGNDYYESSDHHAFIYDGNTMQDIGTLGGADSAGFSINNNGWVTGDSKTSASGPSHAFIYDGNTMQDIGTLGLGSHRGYDINDNGVVVGASAGHAFIYDGNTMQDIGTLGGSTAIAYAINNNGQVVGSSTTAHKNAAFLYNGTTMLDLCVLTDCLVNGWDSLYGGFDINEHGDITGNGYVNGDPHAFLIKAVVPIPAAVWLFGSGLIGLIGLARRKKA